MKAFNKYIDGIENEIEFVNYLNGKKINELNPMFLELIEGLFGNFRNNSVIKCYKNEIPQKTDIYIRIGFIVKRISIKKGIKNSVHVEGISSFIHFLIDNNIKREVIVEYLKYQYADGTTNGTGKIRISSEEYKKNNQDRIDMINKNINTKKLVNKAIDRFVLKGRNDNKRIDAIIYGVVEDFIWITRDDIRKVILSKINDYSTAVHFGPLTCQPMDRCLNRNEKYEKKRFCVQLKWYNICDDIIENMNNNCIRK